MKPAWSLPHRKRMFWPQTVPCFLLLTPWPLPHPPLYKKLRFVSLLRAPVYLLDGMLPDSWMIEWSQLDLQIHSAEFWFFNQKLCMLIYLQIVLIHFVLEKKPSHGLYYFRLCLVQHILKINLYHSTGGAHSHLPISMQRRTSANAEQL